MLTPHDSPKDIIERVQRVARFAAPGADIGLPWDLFESYIESLERMNIIHACSSELRSKRHLAAAVSINTQNARYAGDTGMVWVYPVIA